MDKSSLKSGYIGGRALHRVSGKGDFTDCRHPLMHGPALPVSILVVLHLVEAIVDADGFIHALSCSMSGASVQTGGVGANASVGWQSMARSAGGSAGNSRGRGGDDEGGFGGGGGRALGDGDADFVLGGVEFGGGDDGDRAAFGGWGQWGRGTGYKLAVDEEVHGQLGF